jgi:hypothetical protein
MSIQIFTRYSGSGSHAMSKPRRVCTVATPAAAIEYCTRENKRRARDAIRKGFFYEWTTERYFREAWGR